MPVAMPDPGAGSVPGMVGRNGLGCDHGGTRDLADSSGTE